MIKKVSKIALPIIMGAVGGYLYYYFIGCNNGCAITGSPVSSTAYGAVIGALFTNWKTGIKTLKNEKEENEKEHGNS